MSNHSTAKAITTVAPGCFEDQPDSACKIDYAVDSEDHHTNRQPHRDPLHDAIRTGFLVPEGNRAAHAVERDHSLYQRAERQQEYDDVHERRQSPAENDRRSAFARQIIRVNEHLLREKCKEEQQRERRRSPPSQAPSRPRSQRSSTSILRLTPPASPAGRHAVMAMANAIDVISLSATTPEFASQRSSTSTTVAPAASSIPRTPTIASGRVSVLRLFSRRDTKLFTGTLDTGGCGHSSLRCRGFVWIIGPPLPACRCRGMSRPPCRLPVAP